MCVSSENKVLSCLLVTLPFSAACVSYPHTWHSLRINPLSCRGWSCLQSSPEPCREWQARRVCSPARMVPLHTLLWFHSACVGQLCIGGGLWVWPRWLHSGRRFWVVAVGAATPWLLCCHHRYMRLLLGHWAIAAASLHGCSQAAPPPVPRPLVGRSRAARLPPPPAHTGHSGPHWRLCHRTVQPLCQGLRQPGE